MSLDIYAKQIPEMNISHMDNATLLSFTNSVAAKAAADATLTAKLGDIYTAFYTSAQAYDESYNPSQKDLLSDVLKQLDELRDKALTAWHSAVLAAQKSPNETKKQVALQLGQLYKDYHLDAGDEYMKETTNINQMLQNIEGNSNFMAALPGMGLDDYLTDLKTKNQSFAAKMDERTAGTVGKTTGVVAAARADVEQKYRSFVRMVNVVSSYEGGGVLDAFILVITAEIDHYRQILSRKGGSGGGSNNNGNDDGNGGDNGNDPVNPDPVNPDPVNPDPVNPDPNSGGGDNNGGGGDGPSPDED